MNDFDGYRAFAPDREKLVAELDRIVSWLRKDLERGVGEDAGLFYLAEGDDFLRFRCESKIERSCLFFAVRADRFGVFVEKSADFGSTGK